jgi:mannitol-1-phosphate 5-dehydrogenase
VGCGYLAPMFLRAGWETVLATHSPARVSRIERAGGFTVRMGGSAEEFVLRQAPVVVGTEPFRKAVRRADLVVTAVGRENVCGLGPPLAHALSRRRLPLDIWVVENADCAPILERAARGEAARSGIALPAVGFAGGIAIPVVARGCWGDAGPPEFVRDTTDGLLIDGRAILNPVPLLPGIRATSRYRERLREKLFVFNAGHALFAYLGAHCEYARIDEAARDPLLRTLVEGCLLETRRAVIHAHRGLGNAVVGPVAQAMRRYEDVELADTIRRVARRPIRKLDPDGPLVGAAELVCSTFGRVPVPFVLAIASALLHSDRSDPEVRRLAGMLRRNGIQSVLLDVCGLAPDNPLTCGVVLTYRRLRLGQKVAGRAAVTLAAIEPRVAVQAAAS